MFLFRVLLCVAGGLCCVVVSAQTIRGQLTDAVTREGLSGATVAVMNQDVGTTTDAEGYFRLSNLQPGLVQLEFRYLGYQTLIVPEVEVGSGRERVLQFSLTPSTQELSPAIVRALPVSRQAFVSQCPVSYLTVDQTERMPATFFDPARMAIYLPGTAQQNDQANGVSVRGNSPNQSGWRLNGLDIVNPNHLTNAGTFSDRPSNYGGGTNAISAQLMGTTRFYRGNQPYYYGNVNAGLFDVELRRGNQERQQYALQAGLIGFDATAEGPFVTGSQSSYLINTRYSFTGLLADLGVDFGGEEISFSDVNASLSFPLGAKGGILDVFGVIGSSDNQFTPATDPAEWEDEKSLYEQILYENNLAIGGIRFTVPVENKGNFRAIMGYSEATASRKSRGDGVLVEEEEQDDRQESKFSIHLAYQHQLNDHTQLAFGNETTYREFSSLSRMVLNGTMQTFSEYTGLLVQLFANWRQEWGAFSYDVGFHTSRWQFGPATYLEPRVNVSYLTTDAGRFTLALGQYRQVPSLDIATARHRKLSQAQHLDLNWSFNLTSKARLEVALFLQQHNRLAINAEMDDDFSSFNLLEVSDDIRSVNDRGEARTGGLEMSYEKFAGQGWYLLANTTLFYSEYKGSDRVWRNSRFARDYLANVVVGREWNKAKEDQKHRRFGIQVGLHASGAQPSRPLNIEASRFINQTVYVRGEGFSQNLRPYFRSDLRLYLTQDRPGRTSTLSLDIQNLTNAENDAYVYWDRLLQEESIKKQLGMIPVLNWRLEFGK